MKLAADGQDLAVVNVAIVDTQGRPVPFADNKVTFSVNGPAKVIGVGNGDASCHESDKGSERSVFNGLCMAIVQSQRGQAGSIAVSVTSPGLESATVSVLSAAAALRPVVE